MTTVEPHIEVRNVEAIDNVDYGQAGKIALVGAFPSTEFKLGLFTNAEAAKAATLEEGVTPTGFKAYYCLDYIFNNTRTINGPESVVIVNTNYDKGSASSAAITNAELSSAFLLLAEEDFDILTIGEPIKLVTDQHTTGDNPDYKLNTTWNTIQSFVESQFNVQKPFGIITAVELDENCVANTHLPAFKNLFKTEGIFKAVVTPSRINGDAEALTLEQSAAWQSAYTSGRPVNRSETAKVYPTLIGNNTKDTYPASTTASVVTFNNLRENGFHTMDFQDRRQQIVKCISAITPAGYDMKVERVKNYMIKRLTLRNFLGEDNVDATLDSIRGMFEFEKNLAIETGLILDMDYTLQELDSETVKAQIELYIPEILRVIQLDVVVKVAGGE